MRAIVVGAGIMGLSIAYNLANRGVQVVVVEKQYPGSGLSMRAIGGVHSQWDNEHDIRLAKKSREILAQLPGELNFNIPFRRDGYLMVAREEDEFKRLKENMRMQRSQGLETISVSSEQLGSRYPFLDTSSIVGGTFSKGDGATHPFSLVFGYWNGLKEHGGKVLRSTNVKGLRVDDGRVKAVETDAGSLEGDIFVLAAGAGTTNILQSVGMEVHTELVKHEMLATEPLKFFLKPMIQVWPDGLYVNQSLRGEIITQIQSRGPQVRTDTSSTLEFLEKAAAELTRLIPSLRQVKVLRPWAGLVETTPDLEPASGELGYQNLWVAFADSGKGTMFAPAIGQMISDEILTGQPNQDLLICSATRLLG